MNVLKYGLWCCFAMLLSGCGGEPSYRIGVSQCSDDDWRWQMNNEFRREAMLYDNVEVDIRTCYDDTERQIEDIDALLRSGIDALIVSPNEEAPLKETIERICDSGMPVILIDRKVPTGKYTAYVGADNYKAGQKMGRWVIDALPAGGRVIEITGLESSSSAVERQRGFRDAVAANPRIEIVAAASARWFEQEAEQVTDSLLRLYPDVDLIFAHCDRMALGAYHAAERLGRADAITFVGIDGMTTPDGGVRQMQAGTLDVTLVYPTGGDLAMQTALAALRGEPFERITPLESTILTPENADVMLMQRRQIDALDKNLGQMNKRAASLLERSRLQQLVLMLVLFCLFALIFFSILLWRTYRQKMLLNETLSQQKYEIEQQRDHTLLLSRRLEEATNAKLAFFTNVSHDFRTPLTLILDPLHQLLHESGSWNPGQRELLDIILRNAERMRGMVNQILDFRRYESGKTNVTLTRFDLAAKVREWSDSIAVTARIRHFKFRCRIDDGIDGEIVADLRKVERIYLNLISNALKFTPENGRIDVALRPAELGGERALTLTVHNTGSAISQEHLRNIFDRFYQVDACHAGSGIGLALVDAFVKLHNGTIGVESSPEAGTTFCVTLPCTQEGETIPENELSESDSGEDTELRPNLPEPDGQPDGQPEPDGQPNGVPEPDEAERNRELVLIIDDNPDIRSYIRRLFSGNYVVAEAPDAEEGLRKAVALLPDAIICDVMMPGIDGIECCRRLKSDRMTCHIPVLLLTACAQDEKRVEAFESGADAYIAKPFSSEVLRARIRNLIDNRTRLKSVFTDCSTTVSGKSVTDTDKRFIDKFMAIVEANIEIAECNVENLGREMGFSRVQLYRKVKSLTGYSPNELLRIARLKRARSLLSTGDDNVSEVCYRVGFTSPSYFAKCYKDQFGVSPVDDR